MQRHDRDDDNQREARAILERVRQETEPQIGGDLTRVILRTRDHFSASDVDQDDRVEVAGTRIGRLLGFVAFVLLAASLFAFLTRS
ncbi:hypothetical protein [Mangrovibrevibacter kandeliae]|uniref:hypothetical protein n=1 Tax=Mangrovibrevibacter kandeliae TaxID=2968473 RepID=UPI0021178B54|nr:hypothetical protein [Aurantimonas sp. CSK15Z-1]MCQ8783565.1 hypothetical protein [Aurantimonas sp. CSK15Z-1]